MKKIFTALLGMAIVVPPVFAFTIASIIPNGSNGVMSISAAFDGTNYLVGIQGDQTAHYDISAQLVSQAGTPVGSLISVGRTGGVPYVAFDGSNYLMVWSDDATYPNCQIYGQFVSPAGALVSNPFVIGAGAENEEPGGIAFDGTNYLVVYGIGPVNSPNQLAARFVSKGGTVSSEIVIASEQWLKSDLQIVACNGTSYLVAWPDGHFGTNVLGRFISKTGTLSAPVTIYQGAANDNPLSVSSDGTNFLVVWNHQVNFPSTTNNIWDIYGRVVTPAGGFLGSEFTIAGQPGNRRFPFIAFDSTNYLVGWTDQSNTNDWNIAGQFVTKTGALLGSALSLVTDPGNQAVSPVVYGAGKDLVLWTDGIIGLDYEGTEIKGLFLPLTPTPEPVIGPVIMANGSTNDITISHSGNLSVTVQLNPGEYDGVPVDWWIVARAGSSWFYMDSAAGWTQEGAWRPVHQGGLFNLPATEVLNITGLGTGSYTFYFAVDYPMDGILDIDGTILYDSVNVIVQ